ncbi:hypothetical protein Gpo141_00014393, partial [Globisporangium polare]
NCSCSVSDQSPRVSEPEWMSPQRSEHVGEDGMEAMDEVGDEGGE